MYVCMFRPPPDPYRHTLYGGSRALLPPRITLGRAVDLAFARVSVLVHQNDLLRT